MTKRNSYTFIFVLLMDGIEKQSQEIGTYVESIILLLFC